MHNKTDSPNSPAKPLTCSFNNLQRNRYVSYSAIVAGSTLFSALVTVVRGTIFQESFRDKKLNLCWRSILRAVSRLTNFVWHYGV